MPNRINLIRRRLLLASTVAGFAVPIKAATRLLTPPQTRGPFYPLELPLDSDNDLVTVVGRQELAKGEIVNVVGQVLTAQGQAIRGVLVEIWQCDAFGRYHHPDDRRKVPLDENFQGYGRFTTGADGGYRFRTIKPVPYPGRAPHIHFQISGPGIQTLVTQMYVAGAPENTDDGILRRIREPQRRSVIIEFTTDQGNLPLGRFDIVLQTG